MLQDQSLIPLLKSDLNKHAISKKILDITTIGSTTLLAALVVYTAQTF
ncbi:hypothetical protein GW750_00290 [bacterium]|nr:hypothetical protein [bacterium]